MMARRLEGKAALITGAASGIGAATAEAFVREGARVLMTDLQFDKGVSLARRLDADYMHHDVADEDQWIAAVSRATARFGRLDIVVNNAGVFIAESIEDVNLDVWNKVIGVNLTGTMLGLKHGIRAMKGNPGGPKGSLINVSSITGFIGLSSAAAYTASKGAVRLLTKSVAVHCARSYRTIRCNSIHPGAIDTPMNQAAFDAAPDPQAMRAAFDSIPPVGRMGTAEEMAAVALFLASDESSYVTGTEILADGGWLAASGPL